jgi:alpha-beta hydrolase superfamily lysophospholipase
MPSDNIAMLRAFARDPLVIKATRVDVLYGVSNLMDIAMQAADSVQDPTLLLYGKRDEIIPPQPSCEFLERISEMTTTAPDAIVYEQGYHMLTRDLHAELVMADISAWIIGGRTLDSRGSDMRGYCRSRDGAA